MAGQERTLGLPGIIAQGHGASLRVLVLPVAVDRVDLHVGRVPTPSILCIVRFIRNVVLVLGCVRLATGAAAAPVDEAFKAKVQLEID